MSEQEKAFDPRIGKHGVYTPTVCAGTGQTVNGRHNTAIGLGGGFYCRVLNKWTGDRAALKLELQQVIGQPRNESKRVMRGAVMTQTSEEQSNDE